MPRRRAASAASPRSASSTRHSTRVSGFSKAVTREPSLVQVADYGTSHSPAQLPAGPNPSLNRSSYGRPPWPASSYSTFSAVGPRRPAFAAPVSSNVRPRNTPCAHFVSRLPSLLESGCITLQLFSPAASLRLLACPAATSRSSAGNTTNLRSPCSSSLAGLYQSQFLSLVAHSRSVVCLRAAGNPFGSRQSQECCSAFCTGRWFPQGSFRLMSSLKLVWPRRFCSPSPSRGGPQPIFLPHGSGSHWLCGSCFVQSARNHPAGPNPSLNRSANGRPPGPPSGRAYHPLVGPGVLPPAPG